MDVRGSWYFLPLLFSFLSFFFLNLGCTQKAYYPNVNSIAFVTFFQYLKQTGLGNEAWIKNFMRDFLLPNHGIGWEFCIMGLTLSFSHREISNKPQGRTWVVKNVRGRKEGANFLH